MIKNLAKRTTNFRVSLLLCKEYLDTPQDVMNALVDFYAMGVKNIKLGELSRSNMFVSLKSIFPSIDFSSPCWNGCSKKLKQSPVDLQLPGLLSNGRTLLLKQVCHMNQDMLAATKKDEIKLAIREAKWKITGRHNYLVIYPDGRIEGAWTK
jgi:hypothetical protein